MTFGKTTVAPGETKTINLEVARLYTHDEMYMTAHVIYGKQPGPHLFLSAAMHGDEINGLEIIRRVLKRVDPQTLNGAVIAVPVVNSFGLIFRSRYLPDRRDLNRCFPGSRKGSLASQMARLFMDEIVSNATHGIDFHTGALHRSNLPQIRANLDDSETEKLAKAFGTPVLINANLRDGSLRQAVSEQGIPMLLFEGGEALRFDEFAIRSGVSGTLSLMEKLNMIPEEEGKPETPRPYVANSSYWVRAPRAGILRTTSLLGKWMAEGERLGAISEPLGEHDEDVLTPQGGIVIGQTNLPLVNRGDGMFHLASFDKPRIVQRHLKTYTSALEEYDDYAEDWEGPE